MGLRLGMIIIRTLASDIGNTNQHDPGWSCVSDEATMVVASRHWGRQAQGLGRQVSERDGIPGSAFRSANVCPVSMDGRPSRGSAKPFPASLAVGGGQLKRTRSTSSRLPVASLLGGLRSNIVLFNAWSVI